MYFLTQNFWKPDDDDREAHIKSYETGDGHSKAFDAQHTIETRPF